jgi:uncharacterized protein (DUF1501 family)
VQQDVLEQAGGRGGWLARHLASRASGASLRGAATSSRQPTVFAGAGRTIVADDLDGLDLWGGDKRVSRVVPTLARLHQGSHLEPTAAGALDASDLLHRTDLTSAPPSALGYRSDDEWHRKLHQIALLIARDAGLEAAVVDLDGWDMHANMGPAVAGNLRTFLDRLGTGLAAFQREIGGRQGRVTTVVISEFGRRVQENASSGTDHGHGGVALVLGGGISGGRVYGTWPGLADDQLDDGDLRVTTDFRDVLGEVLARRHSGSDLAAVFPGYAPKHLGICG